MSLAMFAAPFNDNSTITLPNTDNSENLLSQKRHKRTQKRYPNPKVENFDTNKVNSVLQKIHDNLDDDDDPSEFNPPPKPESAGVQKTIPKVESFGGRMMGGTQTLIGKAPSPNYEGGDDLDLNDYGNYGDDKTVEEYYKRVMPGYRPGSQNIRVSTSANNMSASRPYYNYSQNSNQGVNSQLEYPTQDVLLQKLNYMISLLEEQQDEKTNNVTEEVILYSFLGIFIIFIADTFVRAGKYVR